jgi:uncharacterized protein YdeI (YjbR/CyaY-like superfamily)
MITEIADYFAKGCGRCARFDTDDCSARLWAGGLAALRQVCLEAGLEETVKWGHPCYRHADRNVAIIGAFRDGIRLSFLEAGLLTDGDGVLERQGPNTRYADAIRFGSAADVARLAPAIRGLLAQAMEVAEAGLRAPRPTGSPELPADLAEALDVDRVLAAAFAALTPGRQRSHVIALASAKTAATRLQRIERLRPRIMAGKGATELWDG